MFPEGASLCERFPALIALERLLSSVSPHVNFEDRGDPEFLAAHAAFEAICVVLQEMLLQMLFFYKLAPAVGAAKKNTHVSLVSHRILTAVCSGCLFCAVFQ